jgi:hypothetical protein
VDEDEGVEVFCVHCIFFAAVHLPHGLVAELVIQAFENLLLELFVWLNKTHVEIRRDPEPQHAINIHPHHLQMHQRNEKSAEPNG